MKYRKKPVVIEAMVFEYSERGLYELQMFCGPALKKYGKERHPSAKGWAWIKTLEDGEGELVKHVATEGDFIIKGVKGEFYPCKPDIFEMTYEAMPTDEDYLAAMGPCGK
jgi:hypothetical protein